MNKLLLSLLLLTTTLTFAVQVRAESAASLQKKQYDKAKKYYGDGKYTHARILFQEVKEWAIQANNYGAIIDYRIALCYEKENEFSSAIKHFKIYLNAKTLAPKWPTRESVQMRVQRLQKLLRTPTTPSGDAHRNRKKTLEQIKRLVKRGLAQAKRSKYRYAIAAFKRAKRLSISIGGHRAGLDMMIASWYETLKDLHSAIRYYTYYVNSKEKLPKHWPTKAKVRSKIQHLQSLITRSRSGGATDTTNKLYLQMKSEFQLGFLYQNKRDWRNANIHYLKTRELQKKLNIYNKMIDYYIGFSYEMLGDKTRALQFYRSYLSAPHISTRDGWPVSAATAHTRVRALSGDQYRQNIFTSNYTGINNNDYYGNNYGQPSRAPATAPVASSGYVKKESGVFLGLKWYYWVGIAIGASIVLYFTFSGQGDSSSNAKKSGFKSLTPGGGIPTMRDGGINLLRF